MIWSFLKFAVFIGLALAVAFGVDFILGTEGGMDLQFGTYAWHFSPIETVLLALLFALAVWAAIWMIGLLIAILRFVFGDNTAVSRYFDRRRTRKGQQALEEGIVALAAGDGRTAMKRAAAAERLLENKAVSQLLAAQGAQLAGDTARAEDHFKELLAHEQTRFVGIRGLMQQRLETGDTETALKLARKAFETNPTHDATLETLFDLQSEEHDWKGARETLRARIRTKALPKDVGNRRDAVLSLADALASEDANEARDAALAANRIAPALVPAAVAAARHLAAAGETSKAVKVIRKAWAANPHPDLAAAYAALAPDEDPQTRMSRFTSLLRLAPDATETKLTRAELLLAAEDFPGARKALGDLAETDPTARSLSVMAAVERGSGAPEADVSAWLAKAVAAPGGEAWICDKCDKINESWGPLCDHCGSFDTLSWRRPPVNASARTAAAAMLPVLMQSPAVADVTDADDVEAASADSNTDSGTV